MPTKFSNDDGSGLGGPEAKTGSGFRRVEQAAQEMQQAAQDAGTAFEQFKETLEDFDLSNAQSSADDKCEDEYTGEQMAQPFDKELGDMIRRLWEMINRNEKDIPHEVPKGFIKGLPGLNSEAYVLYDEIILKVVESETNRLSGFLGVTVVQPEKSRADTITYIDGEGKALGLRYLVEIEVNSYSGEYNVENRERVKFTQDVTLPCKHKSCTFIRMMLFAFAFAKQEVEPAMLASYEALCDMTDGGKLAAIQDV